MAISLQGFQATQTTTSIAPVRGIRSQIKQDVQQLSTALQSGDLATAQKSYGDLQKLLESNGSISRAQTSQTPSATSSVPSGPLDAIKNDFQALGQALQSGDLAGAQKDYAQLATDSEQIVAQQGNGSKAGRSGGHHHHLADSDGDNGAASANTPAPSSSSSATARASAYQFSFSGSSTTNATTDSNTDPFGQIKTDFQTIGKDLQAGNLNGVQQDYAKLVTDAQKLFSPTSSASSETTAPGATPPTSASSEVTASPSQLSAYQFQASFESTSARVSNGNQNATYQAASFNESFQSVSANQSSAQQFKFQASYQSQSVSYLA